MGDDIGTLRTLAFVVIVFGNQATTYNRERRRLWASRPSLWLAASSVVDIGIASTLAVGGIAMARLPFWIVAATLAAAVVFAFLLDLIKVPVFARLGFAPNPRDRPVPHATQGVAKTKATTKVPVNLSSRIAKRAYELYEQGGRKDGTAVQNWAMAESEIRVDLATVRASWSSSSISQRGSSAGALPPRGEISVPESKPVDPAQMKTCYYFLGACSVMFALGAYTGFVLRGTSVLVFIMLGVSIALFASAFFVALKQHANKIAHPSKAHPQPEAIVESQAKTKAQNHSSDNADVVTLMNTTVGDLLLTAVRKDPEGAKRLFAQAGLQVEAPTAAAPAGFTSRKQPSATVACITHDNEVPKAAPIP
jgi:hypothetical protein